MTTPSPPPSRADRVAVGATVLALSIALGWLGGFAWHERALIGRLWFESSEQRYLTMAGIVGPVTYLVTHEDPRAFARDALALDGVLGVEPWDYPRVSAIAFENADVAAIDAMRALPGVTRAERRFVPMICH